MNRGTLLLLSNWSMIARRLLSRFRTGTRLEAEVVASDKGTGITVLKVDTGALPTAKFGDSDDVALGELTVVLGHTANQEPAISLGMISGVGTQPTYRRL